MVLGRLGLLAYAKKIRCILGLNRNQITDLERRAMREEMFTELVPLHTKISAVTSREFVLTWCSLSDHSIEGVEIKST